MKKKLSVIIAAHNEAKTIGPLVRRLLRWYRRPEVVVIANGCTDGTVRIAKGVGAKVVRFPTPLGPDVGRAIGIGLSNADVYLVIDADVLFTLAQLDPFVKAVERGVDVAMNRYPLLGMKQYHHPTAVAKSAVNIFADRADLRAASLTAVPHALSKKAVEALGPLAFCVPPVAQARAMCTDELRVEAVSYVPVGKINRFRGADHEKTMRSLILGDCLEAVSVLIAERGVRAGFTDLSRRRNLIQNQSFFPEKDVETTAIVPTQGERDLPKVVEQLAKARVNHIRLVANGVDKENLPEFEGGERIGIDYYRERVGHDVGRALGCMNVKSEKYLVTDSDIQIGYRDIKPFLKSIDDGVDIALNRLDAILAKARQTDPPSIVKRFLNIACDRSDLGVSSLTAIPHAFSHKALEMVGLASFAVPPVAQIKALLAGLRVEAVHPVNVIETNTIRPHLHYESAGRPLQRLIIGDYVEAIHELQRVRGARATFADDLRQRDLAEEYLMKRRSSR